MYEYFVNAFQLVAPFNQPDIHNSPTVAHFIRNITHMFCWCVKFFSFFFRPMKEQKYARYHIVNNGITLKTCSLYFKVNQKLNFHFVLLFLTRLCWPQWWYFFFFFHFRDTATEYHKIMDCIIRVHVFGLRMLLVCNFHDYIIRTLSLLLTFCIFHWFHSILFRMKFSKGPKLTAEISFITFHDEIIRHLVLLMAIRIIGLSGTQNI